MSPDDHVVLTKFERTKTQTVVSYGENAILGQVREYVAGYHNALERVVEAFDAFKGSRASSATLHAAVEHARRILEASR
jgi:coenzyme F420-reducing hydrogenase gamma subunit